MKQFSISDVSNQLHLPASTLRYYESIGLLENVGRAPSGKRIYHQCHLDRLYAIECFKAAGMSMAELQDFFDYEKDEKAHIDQMLELLTRKKEFTEMQIQMLQESYSHLEKKLNYYTAIKESYEKHTEHPCWTDFT